MVAAGGRATVRRMPRSPDPSSPNPALVRLPGGARARIRILVSTLLLAVSMPMIGCDRNVEPYQPGEQPRDPDLARIFPGPPGGVGSIENAGDDSGSGSGRPDRTALPPSRAEGSATAAAPAQAAAAGDPIEGVIELAPDLAAARPDGGVLFVIARPQGARGGPPLAVLRIPDPSFPLAFSIGPADVMIPSMTFAGAISLSARLDADGNAMTRGAGDISSQVLEPLDPGTTGVVLELSERG